MLKNIQFFLIVPHISKGREGGAKS